MATARSKTVRHDESGVYHCRCRCVRQAYLCGVDERTGANFDHRKCWVESRLKFLTRVFEIPVYSYAIMSNHLHVVLRTVPDKVSQWSGEQVVAKAYALCPHKVSQTMGPGEPLRVLQERAGKHPEFVELWRERLKSLSWFMRFLNENIARKANREDGCKGRFWEGRFQCSLLADEGAVLACMVYVDLNPVRAAIGETPEDCEFTSIYTRIVARESRETLREMENDGTNPSDSELKRVRQQAATDRWLCPVEQICTGRGKLLVLSLDEYLSLVDYTGRGIRTGCGSIPMGLIPILERLELDRKNWTTTVKSYGSLYWRVAGKMERLAEEARRVGQRWFRCSPEAEKVYRVQRTA